MAFGLSPKYSYNFPLDNLNQEQFLVIALEAAKKLNWNIGYKSETGFIAYTPMSMRSWSEEVKLIIENGVANIKSECTGNQIADWGKNKANVESFLSVITEIKLNSSPEALTEEYDILKPQLTSAADDLLTQPPPTTKEKVTTIFSIFKPTTNYFITPILIDLNILIFFLMVLSGANILLPDTESLMKWGANFAPVTLDGEWWRLITNFFLHIGILHLLLNCYALLYIGLLLEPHLGTTRFVAAYLLSGIAASVASLWWNDLTISAGASGAIFGLYGVFLALLTTHLIDKAARKALLASIIVFVGYNILAGLKTNSGVDNAAHIGGLLSGVLIGYTFIPSLKNPGIATLKYTPIAVLAVVILSTSSILYKNIPNEVGTYDAKMKEFFVMERMALRLYSLPKNTPTENVLAEIKDRGLYYWNENVQLLTELNKLKLPDVLHIRNEKLLRYCNLRIKSYQILYKAIEEDSDRYNDSIDLYNSQIETLINELSR